MYSYYIPGRRRVLCAFSGHKHHIAAVDIARRYAFRAAFTATLLLAQKKTCEVNRSMIDDCRWCTLTQSNRSVENGD